MLRLNLMPGGELGELNSKHKRKLTLLFLVLALSFSFVLIVASVKLYSHAEARSELKKQVADLAKFEEHQKKTLRDLKGKEEKINTLIAEGENSLDLVQFLRLLLHTKAGNVFVTEVKAVAGQVIFSGVASNPASVINFSNNVKKSPFVQEATNFAITKASSSASPKYPLSFSLTVTLKRGVAR